MMAVLLVVSLGFFVFFFIFLNDDLYELFWTASSVSVGYFGEALMGIVVMSWF